MHTFSHLRTQVLRNVAEHILTIKLSGIVLLAALIFYLIPVVSAATAELYSLASVDVDEDTAFDSGVIDASEHEDLVLSFDYDAKKLDSGDSFKYGWSAGGDNNDLGIIEGAVGEEDAETGNVNIPLDSGAEVPDLAIYITVDADSGGSSDFVRVTNILLNGEPVVAARIGGTAYVTIEAALDDAEDGDTIELEAGTHEGFDVDVEGVTIEGTDATVQGQITVSAANVTIDGLTITNPTGGYGILVGGVGGVTISNNTIEDIGTDASHTKTSQAIYVSDFDESDPISGITISGNTITNVGNVAALKKSNKGIYIGDSDADAVLDDVIVDDNDISNIVANATDWDESGYGSYGVQVNWGVYASGKVTNLEITDNEIKDLSGFWVHAIALEADTPSAVVTENIVSSLDATKGTDGFIGDFRDEAGVFFEGNPDADTILVNNNQFSDMYYGVLLHPDLDLGEDTVDATNNWWGDATGPEGSGVSVGEQITFTPWLDAPGGSERSDNVFIGEVVYDSIQDALDAATTTDTVMVRSGIYNEQLTINTPLTLRGAGDDAGTGTLIRVESDEKAIVISADDVTIEGFRLENEGSTGYGLEVKGSSVSNLSLDGVTATGASVGFKIGTVTTLNGLTVTDSHFDDNNEGWNFAKSSGASSATVTNVSVTGTSFNDNLKKGIYAEKLDNATFDDIEVIDSGTDATYGSNNGIDINLKYADYENITIKNSTVSGSGLMGTATVYPAGLTVKARDDGSYSSPAATLTGVTIDNVTVSGGVVGIRFGEGNKSNLGPLNVTVVNSQLTGTGGLGLENSSQATTTATHNYWGTFSADEDDIEVKINGLVTFDPWYLSSSMNALSSDVSGDGGVTPSGSDDLTVETNGTGKTKLPTGVTKVTLGNNSKLDLSAGLETVGSKKQVTLNSGTGGTPVVLKNSSLATASVTIPDGTKISGPSDWDGKVEPPKSSTASGNAPAGFSVGGTVITVGSSDGTLTFNEAVTILLEGVTGDVGYKAAGSEIWVGIDQMCDGTYDAPEDPTDPDGECHISNGVDTKILTFHFTSFGALTAHSNDGGGGGGATSFAGGGSSNVDATPTTGSVSGEGAVLGASTFRFSTNFTIGSQGADVVELQERLRGEGFFIFHTSTGYFGPITQEAVKKYQTAHGISATGFVGPLTIAALNAGTSSAVDGTVQAELDTLRLEVLSKIRLLVSRLQAQVKAN